ncbi:MAG: tyrosine-type recombinase/integrase [Armatimonadetes bacterium]|nr:tyrosine-type recombinase/integrase [Armatimonadota bacterium]
MTLAQAVDEFLVFLDVEKGARPHTLAAYRRDFILFARYLADRGVTPQVENLTAQVLRGYLAFLHTRQYRPASIRRRLYSLSSLCDYLVHQAEVLVRNPVRKLILPKRPRRLPTFLEAEELTQVFDAATTPLERAVVALLALTGLRRGELLALDVADVDLARGTVHVRDGKGGTEALLPLHPVAVAALAAYLPTRRRGGGRAVFPGVATWRRGPSPRMSPHALRNLLVRVARRAGMTRRLYPHLFRHTLGTLLRRNGVPLEEIQELLRHREVASTRLYDHVVIDDLQRAILRHPLTPGHPSADPARAAVGREWDDRGPAQGDTPTTRNRRTTVTR